MEHRMLQLPTIHGRLKFNSKSIMTDLEISMFYRIHLRRKIMKVIESEKLRERKEYTFTLERNVLGVPTFVLNTRATDKLNMLEHKWKTSSGEVKFRFSRNPITPLPQVEHARYFDALVGIFATRWRPDGYLWFSISEVIRFVDLNPNNRGARKAVLETILRYRRCSAEWENSWNGRTKSWNTHFIEETDIWDEQTGTLKRNPRSSRKKEQLHRITFCKHIVESLKDSHTRVFLTDSLKQLKADSYAVYRYFYGFSDRSKVHRNIDYLKSVFPWTGRQSRFKPWLEKRLEECFEKGFIEEYEFKDERVFVKCKSLKEYKDSAPVIEIKHRAKKTTQTKTKKVSTAKMTPEALMEEYYRRKQLGEIKPEHAEVIDMMISSGQQELTISLLKTHLAANEY